MHDMSSLLVDAYAFYTYSSQTETESSIYSLYATTAALSFTGKCLNVRCGQQALSLYDALWSGDSSLQANASDFVEQA